jgi:protein-histidine pros-kinase
VASRDYSGRARKTSDDEVGTLAESFNDMLAEIERRAVERDAATHRLELEVAERRRSEQEIVRLNAGLESRVRERTSELQKSNEELTLAREEADNANRAKSDFLSNMSHELRTPLNAVIGFTGTLLMRLPGPLNTDQETQLRTVQASARHLLALINDLLDLAKIEAGKIELNPEPTLCAEVLTNVAAALRPLAETKGLALVVEPPDAELTVRIDRRALRQIVLNLVNNAIKFTEHGSVRLAAVPCAAGVEIRVHDTGVGIRNADQARLFKAFTQVESLTRQQEGTGLGLHLSQKLADALGGTIVCESEFGRGSTFTLRLPQIPA